MTIIKTVGGCTISFSEDTVSDDRFTFAFSVAGFLLLVGAILVSKEKELLFLFTVLFIGGIFLIFTGFATISGLFFKCSVYRVSVSRWDIESIDIIKTTPEADQIAICKAAQELEQKVRAALEHENELQRIAERCK